MEGITTNTNCLERGMVLFWLMKVFEVRNSKMLQMKTVLTRPVQSDRYSSILRNACWDNAGLANFICSNGCEHIQFEQDLAAGGCWPVFIFKQVTNPRIPFTRTSWTAYTRQAQVVCTLK